MNKYYKSKFYSKPIEVVNIEWEILVIITDNFGREIIYTWYDIAEKNTESIYINKCLLWGFVKKIPENVLIIWFGWWAFAKYLEDHIKKINITWIEIDPVMLDIAKKELKVKTRDFYITDAKIALEKLIKKQKQFDLVLIDVYWWDGEIPEYFSENKFFESINKVLIQDWTISINLADYDLNNTEKTKKYNKIHSNLIDTFWEYYSHILAWENDRWNVIWIYNLDKKYSALDFDNIYIEKTKKWDIVYEEKIVRGTVLEW